MGTPDSSTIMTSRTSPRRTRRGGGETDDGGDGDRYRLREYRGGRQRRQERRVDWEISLQTLEALMTLERSKSPGITETPKLVLGIYATFTSGNICCKDRLKRGKQDRSDKCMAFTFGDI